ncbi:hypothetical protein DPMN_128329 [Dreissena polymorpha]|uniref:Uncharacterized protein n=1 Tax=Dreissena polymorpha TaxID=45954 RepID=A0A9D4H3P3_DREPO|nr:hypothetical protein DPMN_128329 [Dreissena polymorpha]
MRAKKAGQTPKNPEQLEDILIPFPEAYRTYGEPSVKPKKKSTERYQWRLKTLCEQVASGEKSVSQFLA